MNNAKIALDNVFDPEPDDRLVELRKRETELVALLSITKNLLTNPDWLTLKELIFEPILSNLQKRLRIESEKTELNTPEIYRLQGQILWAKRYADLQKLADDYKSELSNLRTNLNAKSN